MSIAAKAVRGAAWNLVAGVGSRIVTIIGTLILTRFIAPDEYGEISAALVTVFTAMNLTDANVGQSIMARKIGVDAVYHAFILHMATAVIALIPVFLFMHRFAWSLDAPGMVRFVPGLALGALLDRFAHVPSRVLVRDMRFRTVALTRGAAEVVFTATALALAPKIHGYAIIVANIVRYTIVAISYLVRLDRREWFVPQKLRWPIFKDLLGYGLPLTAAGIGDYASSNWDNLLVSRFFGPSVMGAYKLAYNLADTPSINVAEPLGDVLLPSFTKMDFEQRKKALVRAAGIMALLVFPLCMGLSSVSPTLVRVLFDARWANMAPLLMTLSAVAVTKPMSWTLTSFLQAQQRPRTLMILGFTKVAVLMLLIMTLGRLGPVWVCVCVGLAFATTTGISLTLVSKADGVPAGQFILGVVRPLLACAPMFAGVLALRWLLARAGLHASFVTLALEMVTGGLLYVGAVFVVARPIAFDVLNLVGNVIRRRHRPDG